MYVTVPTPKLDMTVTANTLIVGASAAGLATAAVLQQAGCSYELLEAGDVVAGAWRNHYRRLQLHTPKSASGLPGLPMPRSWPRYPAREQVVEYLENYRARFDIRPHFGEQVALLERNADGWVATSTSGRWQARNVVIATGATRRAVRPTWPGADSYEGDVLHSSEFCDGEPWRGRKVLVVGFGNSACEQAIDLVEHDVATHMSVRGAVNVLPRELLGIPILQVGLVMRRLPPKLADLLAKPLLGLSIGDIGKLGLQRLPYGAMQQIASDQRIPLLDIGTIAHIKAGRITVHGAIERFTPAGVAFTDGSELDVDAVILGTGYRPALEDFLPEWRAVCDDKGRPLVSGAPTALPGLYFCGQHVTASGMLREIGAEAKRIAADLRQG